MVSKASSDAKGVIGAKVHPSLKGAAGPKIDARSTREELKKINVVSSASTEDNASAAEGMFLHADLQQGLLFKTVVNLFKDSDKVSTSLLNDCFTYKECSIPDSDQQNLSTYDALLLLTQTIQYVGTAQLDLLSVLQTFVPRSRLDNYRLAFALPQHGDMASTYSAAHDTVVSVMSALETTHGVVESIVHTVFNSTEEKDDQELLDQSGSYLDYIRHTCISLMDNVLDLARFMNKCGVVSQATYESIQYGLSRFVDEHVEKTHGPDAKYDKDSISQYVSETCFAISVYYVTMCVYKALRVSVKSSLGDLSANTSTPSIDAIVNHKINIL